MEKRRLGRGLDALLGREDDAAVATQVNEVEVERIQRNPNQPRKSFDTDDIAALSATIKTHGILQPLVVRQVGEQFQLIAGERRLRAAQEAGLTRVPVRVVDFNDQQVLEAALVENIQRSDLNPIEKAQGFKEYLDRFGLNHDQLAQRLGLARSTITNLVNLLELSSEVQDGLRSNQISEAHAKILKGIKDKSKQVAVFKQIVAMGLSVKATEAMLRDQKEGTSETSTPSESSTNGQRPERASSVERPDLSAKTTTVVALENEMRQKLATPVEIVLYAKDRGRIIIDFANNDDFMRVLEVIRRG
jgi:ParB family chromosome partitioning protein